jgi:hypothetical protein
MLLADVRVEPVLLELDGKDDRHPVVDGSHELVRSSRDDRARLDKLAVVRVFLSLYEIRSSFAQCGSSPHRAMSASRSPSVSRTISACCVGAT